MDYRTTEEKEYSKLLLVRARANAVSVGQTIITEEEEEEEEEN